MVLLAVLVCMVNSMQESFRCDVVDTTVRVMTTKAIMVVPYHEKESLSVEIRSSSFLLHAQLVL